jgi:ferredoxin
MAKITLDQGLCIGCGVCAAIAPDVFAIGDDGLAVLLVSEADGAEDAAASCPAQAIIVE